MTNYRAFLIRTILPLSWKLSNERKVKALQEFSMTELDSGWHSLYAVKFVQKPEHKATLFQHAMEEFAHSDYFSDLSQQMSRKPLTTLARYRKTLINDPGQDQLLDFFAYMHVGESAVSEDFVHYQKSWVEPKIKNLFLKIKKDEQGHEAESDDLVKYYSGNDENKMKRYLGYNQGKHARKVISSVFNTFFSWILKLALSLLYYILGLFYASSFKKRLNAESDEQLQILKDQVRLFEESQKK